MGFIHGQRWGCGESVFTHGNAWQGFSPPLAHLVFDEQGEGSFAFLD